MPKDWITDETGMCSDVGQLREIAHSLATIIADMLEVDGVVEAIGMEAASCVAAAALVAHEVTCIDKARQRLASQGKQVVFEIPGGEKTWSALSRQTPQLN